MDAYKRTIGRAYHWASPKVVDEMYCDDKDHHGIIYWYNDAKEHNKQIEEAAKPKK